MDVLDKLNSVIDKLINEIERLKKEVNYYKYDFLTGLKMRKDLDKELDTIFNNKEDKTICLIDLDNLHNINKEKGYSVGDEFIKKVINKLKEIESEDNIYRLGGDEFIIITDTPKEEMDKKLSKIATDFSFFCQSSLYFKDRKELYRIIHNEVNKMKTLKKRL